MTKSRKLGSNGSRVGMKGRKHKAGSGAPRVRKLSPMGADTRNKLLDAAEILFSENGYDGTSLRDIAHEAGLHIALCTYHFGKKELLLEEVIRRRAIVLEKERLAGLHAIDLTRLSPSESVRLIIEAYSAPILKFRYGSSRQRRAYVKLISQLFHVDNWADVLTKNYRFNEQCFLEHWHVALPHADKDALVNAHSYLVASLLFVSSYPNRFDEFRGKSASKRENIESAISDFFRFTHLIFMSI